MIHDFVSVSRPAFVNGVIFRWIVIQNVRDRSEMNLQSFIFAEFFCVATRVRLQRYFPESDRHDLNELELAVGESRAIKKCDVRSLRNWGSEVAEFVHQRNPFS